MDSSPTRYLGTVKARQPACARKSRSTWFPWLRSFRWFPCTGPARGTCLPLGRDGGQILRHRRCRDCWLRVRRSLPAALRRWRRYWVRGSSAPQRWRRLPRGPPVRTFSGRGFSGHGNTLTMRSLWNARHTQSLVDIRTAPRDILGSLYTYAPSQDSPDPCAKETGLRALSRCQKRKRRLDGPLRSESPEPKRRRQSPEPGHWAFRPGWRHGVVTAFVPRPGPLRSSFCYQYNSL